MELPPATTALGALIGHITGGHLTDDAASRRSFQPMNINFGLFPAIEAPTHAPDGRRLKGKERGVARKQAMAERALTELERWLATIGPALTPRAAE